MTEVRTYSNPLRHHLNHQEAEEKSEAQATKETRTYPNPLLQLNHQAEEKREKAAATEVRTYANPLLHHLHPQEAEEKSEVTEVRTYANPLRQLQKPLEDDENEEKGSKSKASKKNTSFKKKLPLLRRTKSSKDVRSITVEGTTHADKVHQMQREELERHEHHLLPRGQGLAKWAQQLSSEAKHKNVVARPATPVRKTRSNSDVSDHDIVVAGYGRSDGYNVDTTTAATESGGSMRGRRERRGAVVDGLPLSPRPPVVEGTGGVSETCARAQLAALPSALNRFESRER